MKLIVRFDIKDHFDIKMMTNLLINIRNNYNLKKRNKELIIVGTKEVYLLLKCYFIII